MTQPHSIIQAEPLKSLIHDIRKQRMILDADSAHGVTVGYLNQAVERQRFPSHFMFQLTAGELTNSRPQIAFSSSKANRPQPATAYAPAMRSRRVSDCYRRRQDLRYTITEYGAFSAANVFNIVRTVQMGMFVVQLCGNTRQTFIAHRQPAGKLAELEHNLSAQCDLHDSLITGLVKAPSKLANPSEPTRKPIRLYVRSRQTAYRTKRKS